MANLLNFYFYFGFYPGHSSKKNTLGIWRQKYVLNNSGSHFGPNSIKRRQKYWNNNCGTLSVPVFTIGSHGLFKRTNRVRFKFVVHSINCHIYLGVKTFDKRIICDFGLSPRRKSFGLHIHLHRFVRFNETYRISFYYFFLV